MNEVPNRSIIPAIFLFAVVTLAVGTGVVIARTDGSETKPAAPEPEIVARPVKSLVIITPPGEPQSTVQSSDQAVPTKSSFSGYWAPEPRRYLAAGVAGVSTKVNPYSNVPNAAPADYAAVITPPGQAQPAAQTATTDSNSRSNDQTTTRTASQTTNGNGSVSLTAASSSGSATASAFTSQLSSGLSGSGFVFVSVEATD